MTVSKSRNLSKHYLNDLVVDRSVDIDVTDPEILDNSGNGNITELYSGRAVELDGVDDYINIGDTEATITRVTVMVKRATAGTLRFRLQTGVPESLAITRVNIWETLEWTGSRTGDAVVFGWDGSTFSDCELADIRVYSGAAPVARWLLNEHTGTDLNDLPCLDSSGNELHGSYIGCTAVTEIGVPEELRGLREWESYPWFTAVGMNVSGIPCASFNWVTDDWDYSCIVKVISAPSVSELLESGTSTNYRIYLTNIYIYIAVGGLSPGVTLVNLGLHGLVGIGQAVVRVTNTRGTYRYYRNGVLIGTSTPSAPVPHSSSSVKILTNNGSAVAMLRSMTLNGTLIAEGNGTTSAAWGGGTVLGNLNTIGELRRTPLQVGLMGWNKEVLIPIPVVNPGFDSSSSWSVGVTWTISGGVATCNGVGSLLYQAGPLKSGGGYTVKVTVTISNYVSGLLQAIPGGYISVYFPAGNGRKSLYINVVHPSSNDRIYFGGNFEGSIDDVELEYVYADAIAPATLSDPTQDALGNPIAVPRRLGETRFPATSDYGEIPDSSSLDLTTQATWVIAGNFYTEDASNKLIMHRWDATNNKRSWSIEGYASSGSGRVAISLSSNGSAASYIGYITVPDRDIILAIRFNGAINTLTAVYYDNQGWNTATVTTVSGAVPSSLFATDIGMRFGADFDGTNGSTFSVIQPKVYNRSLTDAELLNTLRAIAPDVNIRANWPVPDQDLLLYNYPGAAAAYSLRALGRAWNKKVNPKPIVRVRRSSDDALRDFSAREVNGGILEQWVGAGNDGFVQTWYDQSGNGYDATQAVDASQPQIVAAGALVTDGIRFDGSDKLQGVASFDDRYLSTFIVVKVDNTSARNTFFDLGKKDDVTFNHYAIECRTTVGTVNTIGMYASSRSFEGTALMTSNHRLITVLADARDGNNIISNTQIYADGVASDPIVQLSGPSGPEYSTSPNGFAIGGFNNANIQMTGHMRELVVYASNQTTTRASVEGNIGAAWGVTLP